MMFYDIEKVEGRKDDDRKCGSAAASLGSGLELGEKRKGVRKGNGSAGGGLMEEEDSKG